MAKNALQISDRLAAVAAAESLPFRQAPHNLEAEQALLGAILVNNEAMDRVSSFLDPHHFYDPLHQQIYETAGKLIHVGKQATPITLRTFFETAEPISPTLTVPQYLGTLAAQATTIINAEDYGRTVFDLATRRALIIIGEDMVNGAYDSTVDATPQLQIEEAETRLYDLAEQRKYGQGFLGFGTALTNAIEMASAAYQRSGHLSGLSTGLDRSRQQARRPAVVGSHHPRRPPIDGQDGARDQHRLPYRQVLPRRAAGGRDDEDRSTAPSSASSRSKCRPSSWQRVSFPSRRKSARRRSAAA